VIPPVPRPAIYKFKWARWIPALILCLGLSCSGGCAQAQGFDATGLRQPTDLAAGWLIHAGDDPAYARPEFDDSHWTPFNAQTEDLHDLFPQGRPEVVWYRLRVKVAPNQTGLALLENNIELAFEVYCNGVKLLQVGEVAPFVPHDPIAKLLLPIPDNQIRSGSVVIAVRVHISASGWAGQYPGLWSGNLTVGQESALQEHMWLLIIGGNALIWLRDLVRLAMCIGAWLLFLTQRERDEYLWLFLLVLCEIPNMLIGLFELTHTFPISWSRACLIVSLPYCYFFVRMYCSFVGHRVGWKLQIYTAGVTLAYAYLYFADLIGARSGNGLLDLIAYTPFVVLMVVILPAVMLRHVGRGKYLQGLLLIPLFLADLGFILEWLYEVGSQIPALRAKVFRLYFSIASIQAGPFTLRVIPVAETLEMLSLALIILIRSNHISRQHALLDAEIANAREIQQVILPGAVETVPGFRIESVYEPAQQVGGDFFQILPVGDNCLLLVIGDVAGKGLPAAMLVSVLVGAIRTVVQYSHVPTEVLAQLNERMIGRTHGGFSTALAALFDANGSVTIANAGHLPPYLDGREVEIPGALPLGIVSSASYQAVQLCLEPGSRFTFYSDGVIEAQNKEGELFGFERGRQISIRPVAAIVEAARQFGQQDDITVVSIERLATIETSSAPQTASILVRA
jgi:hypothetical protein